MKPERVNLNAGAPWGILLFLTNLFFIFTIWLTSPKAFRSVVIMMMLFTAAVVLTGYWIHYKKQKNQIKALEAFLLSPDEETERTLLETASPSWHPIIHLMSTQMREQIQMAKDKQLEQQNYQEFIEAWTHEIKTPLSLAALVLNNHKDAMSPYVFKRMEYVQNVIGSDVEKILHYARLHSSHVEYKFEKITLSHFLEDCLDSFRAISDEKSVSLQMHLLPLQIVSDKRVLAFMISQLLSNAFKYTAAKNGIINIINWKDNEGGQKIHLVIRDNGKGVPPEDLPFLFDKGFTGNHPERQNATGMGLYLVEKYSEALSIEVSVGAISTSGKGFEIELVFPDVENHCISFRKIL